MALNSVPYEQMFTNIDAQLQAGNPPDIFRVPYYTFGSYAGRSQLLNLQEYLPDGFSDRFTEAAWAAVQNQGGPFGVPHHTDTSAIFYNKDLFASAGIKRVPGELSKAWSWEQFDEVLKTLKTKLPSGKYPFAYNWQGNGVTRWLSWLFEADGRFLAENLKDPAIDSEAGRAASITRRTSSPRITSRRTTPSNPRPTPRTASAPRPSPWSRRGRSPSPMTKETSASNGAPPSSRATSGAPAISEATLWSPPRRRGIRSSPRRSSIS